MFVFTAIKAFRLGTLARRELNLQSKVNTDIMEKRDDCKKNNTKKRKLR